MFTPRMNFNAALTKNLISRHVFQAQPVTLLDIGASGGIDQHWFSYDPDLACFAFEPLTYECDRLNAQKKSKSVSYIPLWITAGADCKEHFPLSEQTAYERSSYGRFTREQKNFNYTIKMFNDGNSELKYTDERASVDAWVKNNNNLKVDFIKIDTDGFDIQVLHGAQKTIDSGVLALQVEAQLHGSIEPTSNTLTSIDLFLRKRGFKLFDIEVYRYAKGTLPSPFLYDIPAQTKRGQVVWGDTFYARDLGDPHYENKFNYQPTKLEILKLATFFEHHGLEDCAAELLLKYEKMFDKEELETLLNLLTPQLDNATLTFREYNEAFTQKTELFFPKKVTADPAVSAAQKDSPMKRKLISRCISKLSEGMNKCAQICPF